jgi:hypothetical protein
MYNIYIYTYTHVIYTLHIHYEIYWYVHYTYHMIHITGTSHVPLHSKYEDLPSNMWFDFKKCWGHVRTFSENHGGWGVFSHEPWTGKHFFPKGKLLQRSRMEELKAHRDREGEKERQQTETWSWIIIYIILYILYYIIYICGQTLHEDKYEDLCISYHIIAQHISYYTYYIIIHIYILEYNQ